MKILPQSELLEACQGWYALQESWLKCLRWVMIVWFQKTSFTAKWDYRKEKHNYWTKACNPSGVGLYVSQNVKHWNCFLLSRLQVTITLLLQIVISKIRCWWLWWWYDYEVYDNAIVNNLINLTPIVNGGWINDGDMILCYRATGSSRAWSKVKASQLWSQLMQATIQLVPHDLGHLQITW